MLPILCGKLLNLRKPAVSRRNVGGRELSSGLRRTSNAYTPDNPQLYMTVRLYFLWKSIAIKDAGKQCPLQSSTVVRVFFNQSPSLPHADIAHLLFYEHGLHKYVACV